MNRQAARATLRGPRLPEAHLPRPDLTPGAEYSLDPIDWRRASGAFREFFRHYFVDSSGLTRGEVDLGFLRRLRPDEAQLAKSLVRRNLRLAYTHLIDGAAELGDREACAELRAMLAKERDLSRKLTLGRALWRLERDPVFPALLGEMTRAEVDGFKEAHIDDVLLLLDERSVELLMRLLDDPGDFVRALALGRLNGIELRRNFLLPTDELPHDAAYYKARRDDPAFRRDARAQSPIPVGGLAARVLTPAARLLRVAARPGLETAARIRVMPAYTSDDFRRMALERFPELREDFEDYDGLVHLQMASFARRTQEAKGQADWDTYERCIALAEELWKRPDAQLLNALNVSFLENIDFDGPRGPVAWQYLSPDLRRAWERMHRYLENLAALARKSGKRQRPR